MDDIVVGTLCEGTVYVAERQQSVFCHTARECHGMSLSDTHVEGAFGHFLHHDVHGASRRHGRCHAHDVGVLLGQFEQCLAEYRLEFRRFVLRVLTDALARVHVEFSRCVPDGGLALCRCISVTFLGVQVEQFRTLHVLQLAEQSHQFLDVVSVERSEVADVHALEDVLLMRDGTFQCVAQSDDTFSAVIL